MPPGPPDSPTGPRTLPGTGTFEARLRTLRLDVLSGEDAGLDVTTDDDRCVIGTHESAQLRLHDRTVSRFHCEVSVEAERVMLTDLGSRNGTFVNDVRIERCVLHPGAVITVGSTRIGAREQASTTTLPLSARDRFGTMVGTSRPMRRVFELLERAAVTDSTILLTGETGTGKEAAAESIHQESPRAEGPFVVVDCGSLPANLLESELFGHEKGAFTDAAQARSGAFEVADGGTIFLDEIGEMPLELQPKLLRVIEKRQIKRLGASQPRSVDVRVVAATNRDLRAEVNSRAFRSDLYYRLAVLEVRLPPLRDRPEDLPLLVPHLLASFGRVRPEIGAQLTSPERLVALERHAWPGNVRELRNHLERCIALREAISLETGEAEPLSSDEAHASLIDPHRTYTESRKAWLETFELRYLEALLELHGGNVSAAARAARIDRAQLYRLLWRHGLRDRS